jgi:hypothetical protein
VVALPEDWAGRGLQPRPQRFIETAAQRKRSGTGCKPVPAQLRKGNPLWLPFLKICKIGEKNS